MRDRLNRCFRFKSSVSLLLVSLLKRKVGYEQIIAADKSLTIFFFFFFNYLQYRRLFYKLKFTNKRKIEKIKICHPIFPSLRLMKNNPFCLLPRLKTYPLPAPNPQPPDLKAGSDKMSKMFGLPNIFN